jgi:hypothetical protein
MKNKVKVVMKGAKAEKNLAKNKKDAKFDE